MKASEELIGEDAGTDGISCAANSTVARQMHRLIVPPSQVDGQSRLQHSAGGSQRRAIEAGLKATASGSKCTARALSPWSAPLAQVWLRGSPPRPESGAELSPDHVKKGSSSTRSNVMKSEPIMA